MHQRTIRKPVTIGGVGLHSGKPAKIVIAPAPADIGIVFHVDGQAIHAAPESVVDSHYATTVGRNGARVRTIEHLMAAAAGLGIDNLAVHVEGPEIPAADGSAKPFVTLLMGAGRSEQSARRRPIVIPFPVRVGTERRWIQIVPADHFCISYTLDNDHPAIGTQTLVLEPGERTFVDELAPARTYGFLKDVGTMRRNGLARGGSLDNAVVVGKRGPINGLRYGDEFVRHKVLDLVGDLFLLGRPVLGHVVARNAGHDLNYQLAVAIQRAMGLERRAVAAARAASADAAGESGFLPLPGFATI